jgi:hypothetical protein
LILILGLQVGLVVRFLWPQTRKSKNGTLDE